MLANIVNGQGRMIFRGNPVDEKFIRLISEGNTRVDEPMPNDHSKWNGSAWVEEDSLAVLKASTIKKFKRRARAILSENFDHHLIQNLDPQDGTAIPTSARTYKNTIKSEFQTAKTDINALTSHYDIRGYKVVWSAPPTQ